LRQTLRSGHRKRGRVRCRSNHARGQTLILLLLLNFQPSFNHGTTSQSTHRCDLGPRAAVSRWQGDRWVQRLGTLRYLIHRLFLGMFVTEALHPFNVFRDAGFEVDLVSETGTYQADWLSQQKDWLSGDDRRVWEDPRSDFRKKLDEHLKPSDIKAENVSDERSFNGRL
jgi:hypothetical protein